jgi:hypothetical protein
MPYNATYRLSLVGYANKDGHLILPIVGESSSAVKRVNPDSQVLAFDLLLTVKLLSQLVGGIQLRLLKTIKLASNDRFKLRNV